MVPFARSGANKRDPSMNLSKRLLHFGCAAALLCLFTSCNIAGQSTELSVNRVTQVPDENARVTLRGNVHPLARDEFSRGAVADSLSIEGILLLLKRSDAQEAAQVADAGGIRKTVWCVRYGSSSGVQMAERARISERARAGRTNGD